MLVLAMQASVVTRRASLSRAGLVPFLPPQLLLLLSLWASRHVPAAQVHFALAGLSDEAAGADNTTCSKMLSV